MGLGSGEWSRWVARWALCAPSQPSQPANQRWACVPELSQVSDLLSGESSRAESSESSLVVVMGPRRPGARPLAKPDPFRRSRSQSLARSPSLSRHTPSGIVSKRGHKRVPISSSCWPTLSRAGRAPRHTLLPFSISRFLSTIRPVRINRTREHTVPAIHPRALHRGFDESFSEKSI